MLTIANVDMAKVNRSVLDAAYVQEFGKEAPSLPTRAVADLAQRFKETAKDTIMECDTCGGGSPAHYDACPFCGDGEVADEEDEVVETAGEEQKAVEEVDNGAEDSDTETGELAKQLAEEEDKMATAKKATRTRRAKETAIVPAPESEQRLTAASVRDLDDSLARVKTARDAGAAALWDLSVELRAIYDNDLWKLRNDEDGKPKYKTFAKFLAAEVEFHERTVWRMIEVAKQFSPDDATKYGVSVLRGLLAAPKEERGAILEKIDKGEVSGKRGVEREVAEIRKRKQVDVVQGAGKGRFAEATKAAAEKAAEKRKVVTVTFPAGRKTVKLFAKSVKPNAPEKRAKKLADRPWGRYEAPNGTAILFAVTENAAGEMELTIETRRD